MEYNDLMEHRVKIRNRGQNSDNNFNTYKNESSGKLAGSLPGQQHFLLYIFNRIWSNKRLRLYFILLVIILVGIIILSLIALMPLFTRIIEFVTQGGVNGVIDSIDGYIEKFRNVSGE